MQNYFKLAPLLLWFSLSLVELSSLFFQSPKPMYFRAWEYALNEGKDSYYVPFKPLISYQGTMQGDLLSFAGFTPHPADIRPQQFITDEYGYRNKPSLLAQPIKAVLIGTSFVGGAQADQSELISTLLTEKYQLPTYNYATLPLQHFWEDERFLQSSPPYVLIVGSEAEMLQNSWIEVLQETTSTHPVRAWSNTSAWQSAQDPIRWEYPYFAKQAKRFSITRHTAKELTLQVQNQVFTRAQIAQELIRSERYDPLQDILFWDLTAYNPLLTEQAHVQITQTVRTLSTTQQILAKRQIKLIVAIMPDKSSLYASRYKDIPLSQKSLPLLEQRLTEAGIDLIPLSGYSVAQAKSNEMLYFPDDSHWHPVVNIYLSEQIATKIQHAK